MKEAFWLFVVRFAVFIILISCFITIGTVALHELGHSLAASYFGCSKNTIQYVLGESPYTDIECDSDEGLPYIINSGIVITTLFSVLLFFAANGILRYVSTLIFGLGLIVATYDLYALSVNIAGVVVLNFIGFLIVCLGVIKIAWIYFYEREDS